MLLTEPVQFPIPLKAEPGVVIQVPKVSVIIPAYNEEETIVECITSAGKHLDRLRISYEIIVVDDGSTDSTRTKALSVHGNSEVKIVGYSCNRGKGAAIKYGAKYASGEMVVFIDGDTNVKPELINEYVNALRNSDIAIASKRHPSSRVSAPFLRIMLSRTFHCLVVLMTGVQVSDTQSGFKAFRREALTEIMGLVSVKRYAFDVELLAIARLLKMRIVELPITIELGSLFSVRQVARMFVDLLGITYRLRVIRWYQKNLHNHGAPPSRSHGSRGSPR